MDKIQKRWDRLKWKREPCPDCGSINIHLNQSMNRRFKRYWLECFNCHWCAGRGNTIRGAIRKWNKDGVKAYCEMLKRVYSGE